MPRVFTEFVQYSPLYWEARRGLASTSNFDRILTPAKGEPSKSQDEYICELIAERANFDPPFMTEKPMNAAMAEGIRREPESRLWYSSYARTGVEQVGGVLSDCGRWWCSPDGLVGDDGVLELKNPLGKTHVKYLIASPPGKPPVLPAEYRCQVHGQLIVTGRAWVDFVSYVPGGMRPLVVRVVRDEFTARLSAELEAFWRKFQAALAAVSPAEVPA